MNARYVGVLGVLSISILGGCASWVTPSTNGDLASRPAFRNRAIADSTQSTASEKAEAHYALGKSFVTEKKWQLAMNEFNLALDFLPTHVDAANGKGLVLAERGFYQEALITLNAALELRSDSAVTRSNLAYVLLKLDRLSEAAKMMRSAYDLDPRLSVIRSNWVELVRKSLNDPQQSAELKQYPLGTSPFALESPQITPQIAREVATTVNQAVLRHTAVINIPAFPVISQATPGPVVVAETSKVGNPEPRISESSATVVNLNYNSMQSSSVPIRQAETFSPPVANVRENTLVMVEPPKAPEAIRVVARVEVVNGNGTPGAAARYGRTLSGQGLKVVKLTNAKSFAQEGNVVYYQRGQSGVARAIASELPGKAVLIQVGRSPGFDVRVILGRSVKRTMI